MASLPLVLKLIDDADREWYNPYYDFGLGIQPQRIASRPRHQPTLDDLIDYTLPLRLLAAKQQLARRGEGDDNADIGKLATIGKDGFKVCMDVGQFKPNELNVKVVDNTIIVEGKHEEREDDHGYISRHFVRRYALPKGYEEDKVASSLSSDGVLTVTVPKPQAIEDKTKERVIEIRQTGAAHCPSIKDKAENESKDKPKAALRGSQS